METDRELAAEVAGQIREILSELEEAGDALDVWQSDRLAQAIAHYSLGRHSLALSAASHASRPRHHKTGAAVAALAGNPTLTVAEVRAELERAIARRAG